MEESEKDLRDRESSILQRDTLQNQRKLSRDERRERREQRQREAEQDANWPDTDHQGFITLFAPDRDMLRSHVYDLRRAIDGPFEPKLLHTIPRVGYRLAMAGEGDGGE